MVMLTYYFAGDQLAFVTGFLGFAYNIGNVLNLLLSPILTRDFHGLLFTVTV